MATHLAHKLPWGNLVELFMLHPPPDPTIAVSKRHWIGIGEGDPEKKKLDHFVRCFTAAVQEFRESDQSTEEERDEYDPRAWPGDWREHGAGAWAGFFDSLIASYVHLNLILSDPDTFLPRISPAHGARHNSSIALMLGHHDGGHAPQLATHLQQAFDGEKLKPMSAEVTQIIRDHAAKLFRCMYSVSGTNEFIDVKMVTRQLLWECGFQVVR